MPYYAANNVTTHVHHVIPTHANGGTANNHPDNLVELTIEQHAEAHRQLWLANGDVNDRAAWLMLSEQITYEECRRIALREKQQTPEYSKAMSAAKKGTVPWNKGRTLSPEHRARLSASNSGQKRTKRTRRRISRALKGNTYRADSKID